MSLDFRLSGARFEEEGWLNSVRGLEQVTPSAKSCLPLADQSDSPWRYIVFIRKNTTIPAVPLLLPFLQRW